MQGTEKQVAAALKIKAKLVEYYDKKIDWAENRLSQATISLTGEEMAILVELDAGSLASALKIAKFPALSKPEKAIEVLKMVRKWISTQDSASFFLDNGRFANSWFATEWAKRFVAYQAKKAASS